jgi:hypothetical protein
MENRKRNTGREQRRVAERDELLGARKPESKQSDDQKTKIDEEWHTLNAQIGALETFITGATRRVSQQRQRKLQNILPPPDRADFPRDRTNQRMSRWQERYHRETRQRHGITFFFLFLAACALVWWLLNGGGAGLP